VPFLIPPMYNSGPRVPMSDGEIIFLGIGVLVIVLGQVLLYLWENRKR
jgi:hypothetical protein